MNYLNREFSKKKNWMAKKHIQRSLTLLLIRKKCKFKPQGDTISIKKKKDYHNKYWQGCGDIGTRSLLVEM